LTDFREAIGLVLRYGVIASFIIVALGSVLLFLEGQTGYYPMGSAEQLLDSQNRFLIGLAPLIQGVASAKPMRSSTLGWACSWRLR